jgi:hypothetical protein
MELPMLPSAQDFPSEVCEALQAYVYRLIDPRTGETFYVGKGRGNRVFQHARLAITGEDGLRYERIREIRGAGLEPAIMIHRHGLSDEAAYYVEAALIDAYGGLLNTVAGHDSDHGLMTLRDITETYGAAPAEITVPAILIKIERQWQPALTPAQLYERTRRYWVCRPERQTTPPKYALSVAKGLIREVYEIDDWEDYPNMSEVEFDPDRLPQVRSEATRGGQARRGFVGHVTTDETLRAALRNKSVRHVRFGVGNPIAYVNCG